jgi:hypothetical protein
MLQVGFMWQDKTANVWSITLFEGDEGGLPMARGLELCDQTPSERQRSSSNAPASLT